MNESPTDIETALEEARRIQADLDKRVFYLETLLDTSRELAGIVQPGKILDTFLLLVMGPLGIIQGLGGIVNTATGQGYVTGRGIPESVVEEVRGNLPHIRDRYFPRGEHPSYSVPRAKVITRESLTDHGLCPAQMEVLILWDLSGEFSGFLGLGERISGQTFGDDDLNILLNLTNILTNALSHALSFRNVQQLNSDLQRKNAELQSTLEQVREAQDELDRRVFHLTTLSDLNTELSSLIEVEQLLRHFLLVVTGSLGIGQGFILVYDREKETGRTASLGIERGGDLEPADCEKLLYKAFDALESKSLIPMTVSRITTPELFKAAGAGIDAGCGFFFIVDQSFMGTVAFGAPLSGRPFSEDEMDLMATQLTGFMAFLKNAKAFETIGALNEDLTLRNVELRQTITELTEAQHKITILEKARARIKALVQKETERIGRVSALDFALILLLAAALGVLFNFASPQGIPLLPDSVLRPASTPVSVTDARKLIEEGRAVLVDARPKELYTQKHIKGAISLPLTLFDIIYMMKLSRLDPEQPVIVYGRHISRLYDEEVAYRLKQRDHEDVRVLAGGMDAWQAQGYQVEQ